MRRVGVLVLVEDNSLIPGLDLGRQLRMPTQQVGGQGDQVGVVHDPEPPLVGVVPLQCLQHLRPRGPDLVAGILCPRHLRRGQEVIAQPVSEDTDLVHPPRLGDVDMLISGVVKGLAQDLPGKGRRDHPHPGVHADKGSELGEHLCREPVIGVHLRLTSLVADRAEEGLDSTGKLGRGLVGERDPQNPLRVDTVLLDEIGDDHRHRCGLAGPGSRPDPDRVQTQVEYRPLLRRWGEPGHGR